MSNSPFVKYVIGAVVVTSVFGIFGKACSEYNKDIREQDARLREFVEGVVIKESGNIVDRVQGVMPSTGAFFGNDSVKFAEPTYALQFKTPNNEIYTVQVTEDFRGKKLEALALAVETGTKIRIQKVPFDYLRKGSVTSVTTAKVEVLQ